jgi:hypothetical protein
LVSLPSGAFGAGLESATGSAFGSLLDEDASGVTGSGLDTPVSFPGPKVSSVLFPLVTVACVTASFVVGFGACMGTVAPTGGVEVAAC